MNEILLEIALATAFVASSAFWGLLVRRNDDGVRSLQRGHGRRYAIKAALRAKAKRA